MPIRLTWTAPVFEGAGVIAYKLYKTISPGPISQLNLFQVFDGITFSYDDYAYNRRTLEDFGYLYVLTALNTDGESDFLLSVPVLVQFPFEAFVHLEEWEFAFTGTDILELFEEWNITLPSIPVQQYIEDWNYLLIPSQEYDEPWDYALVSFQEYTEPWDYAPTFTPDLEYMETWDYSLTPSQQYVEPWEITFTPTIMEPWEYPPPTYAPTMEYDEGWGSTNLYTYMGSGGVVIGGAATTEVVSDAWYYSHTIPSNGGSPQYISDLQEQPKTGGGS